MTSAETRTRLPGPALALDFLAAAVVALAVFALPLSALYAGTNSPNRFYCDVGLPLECLLAAGAIVWLVRGPDWPAKLAAFLGAAAVTWVGALLAAGLGLAIVGVVDSGASCHTTARFWGVVAFVGPIVIYTVVAAWALRGRIGPRFFLGPAAGAVLGIAWFVVIFALTRHAQPGFCGTD